ncbi:MAG TPA: biotin--[acetyl-CoA-carboxylase] ligase [Aquabacterium sp.]|nr:biotin--[acetyl-CoA-carboxylase] ligase [Aquabacterium sp.]
MSQPLTENQALADLHAAAETIWQNTEPHCPGLTVDVIPSLHSTNTALMQQARQGNATPTLLTAVHQTAGKGRQGRQWSSAPGQSLTFSLGLPLRLESIPGGGSALSLAVGLSLARSIDAAFSQLGFSAPVTQLKWPNDLWWHQRKLGGILIEVTAAPGLPSQQRWVVIGVGLNIGQMADAPQSASLQEHWPQDVARLTPGQAWTWVAPDLVRTVLRFEQQGFAPLAEAFRDRDALFGQEVQLWTGAGSADLNAIAPHQHGKALGVNEQGALLVHTDSQIETWTTGDVSVRLRTP